VAAPAALSFRFVAAILFFQPMRAFHQQHSGPVMDQLHQWLTAQLEEKKVEPNSGLGGAIAYLLKYWERLTLFLRQPGAVITMSAREH